MQGLCVERVRGRPIGGSIVAVEGGVARLNRLMAVGGRGVYRMRGRCMTHGDMGPRGMTGVAVRGLGMHGRGVGGRARHQGMAVVDAGAQTGIACRGL